MQNNTNNTITTNATFDRLYIICKHIASGGFGIVCQGIHKMSKTPVAIKLEKQGDIENQRTLLIHEATILNYLAEYCGESIPAVKWFGNYRGADATIFKCIVMPFYTMSCSKYFAACGGDVRTITKYICECVSILEDIHRAFVIHRDIKPANFMCRENRDGSYAPVLIDFGFSTFYVNAGHKHIENTPSKNILGSPKYISLNIHEGMSGSRRDDIISLLYIWIEALGEGGVAADASFFNATCPIISADIDDPAIAQLRQQKINIMLETNDCVPVYSQILANVYNCGFKDAPNYADLRRDLVAVLARFECV